MGNAEREKNKRKIIHKNLKKKQSKKDQFDNLVSSHASSRFMCAWSFYVCVCVFLCDSELYFSIQVCKTFGKNDTQDKVD